MQRAVLILISLAVSNAALADSSRAPATDIWTQSTLLGEWGGLRPRLESAGIAFSLNYTAELLANRHGGIRRGEVVDGLFQPQMDLDLGKLLGWNGDRFRASAVITHGPRFSENYLGNILAASNIEAGSIHRLFELWYEKNTFNDRFSIRAGLMLADAEFLTSETASTFTNNSIGWLAWLAENLPGGGPAYPIPAPGARIRFKPTGETYVQAAVFSGDPTGGNGSNQNGDLPTGTVFSFSGGAFLITELGYTPNQDRTTGGVPGAYKIGAWYHTSSRFGDQRFDETGRSLADPLSSGIPSNHTGNWGIYGVIDQMLYRVPGTEDQGLSAFVRVGGSPDDRNLINFYADGGLAYKGLIPGRPNDKIGVAAAYARISDQARALDRDFQVFANPAYPVRNAEIMVELTYQAKLAPWWTLQASFQNIVRPGGGVLNDDGSIRPNAQVFGLRSAVTF
ncbi:MAG TPA: carbohydrate porin [Pseudolabrys sp.]|nr:carbohydrate porin [Pseudolabrys sp.]